MVVGEVGDESSAVGRGVRSVAVYESLRIGNVTSEAIELRERCRGCLPTTRKVAAVYDTVAGVLSCRSAKKGMYLKNLSE